MTEEQLQTEHTPATVDHEDDVVDFENTQYKGQSASYTDADGYTVTITAKQGHSPVRSPSELPECSDAFGLLRAGWVTIAHPSGESVVGGFWMDVPEAGWTHPSQPDVDLEKDWLRHLDLGTRSCAVWYRVPIEDRLLMEARQQATAYQSLKVRFAERVGWTPWFIPRLTTNSGQKERSKPTLLKNSHPDLASCSAIEFELWYPYSYIMHHGFARPNSHGSFFLRRTKLDESWPPMPDAHSYRLRFRPVAEIPDERVAKPKAVETTA